MFTRQYQGGVGTRLDVVWRQFVVLTGIGAALFAYALARFRATIGTMV